MNRIDDADRDARRADERRELHKKEDQQRVKQRAERTAFSKLVPSSASLASATEPLDAPSARQSSRSRVERQETANERRRNEQIGADTSAPRGELSRGAIEPTGGASERGTGEGDARSDSSGRDQTQGDASPGFRFNPALIPPTPVAKPKEATSSDRLRALAAEIAQKIVERARVGTDRSGRAEFQIDLRSDVLSGLSIRISAANGKVQASFFASDRAVAKLIRNHAGGLRDALGRRGLSLDELRIEERP